MIEEIITKCKESGAYTGSVVQGMRKLSYCGMLLTGVKPEGYDCEYCGRMFSFVTEDEIPRIRQVYQCLRPK